MYRFLRCFLCLLVVCCLILNLSPIKADAAAATVAIAGASTVAVPAAIVVGAALIALGLAAAANLEGFQNMVDASVSALESAGTWVKDGMAELLRTEDADGNASYYVDSGMMNDVWNFLWDDSLGDAVLQTGTYSLPDTVSSSVLNAYNRAASHAYAVVVVWPDGYGFMYNDEYPFILSYDANNFASLDTEVNVLMNLWNSNSQRWTESYGGYVVTYTSTTPWTQYPFYFIGSMNSESVTSTSFDVTLGTLPAQSSDLTDGTSARQWSEEYTDRGLYVVEGSGGGSPPEGDDNNNNGKWYWPVVLAGAAGDGIAGVAALTQQDQWTGDTPEDFNDYTTGTEYEIVGSPEVEFGTGIELVVPDPAPDSGVDSGDNPGAGTDPDEDPDAGAGGSNDYSSWLSKILVLLEKIWNLILEIPTKFATWFDNIISEIQELPSKFATWFENIISAIQELPSKFADWFGNLASKLENIWEAICNIPEAIGNVLRSIFVPSEDFLTEKVQDLRSRFNWIEPILGYGDFIKAQLVNPEPPVLYVHLGNAEGSYNYGGTVKFLDLTWYERYKPLGDTIISGFLWALFAWRMYVKLPGIINGVAGDVGQITYGESAWQKAEGRKDRKEKGGKNK